MLGFEYNKDINLDLKQTETGETVGMAFNSVTSCDICLNDTDSPFRFGGAEIAYFYFECASAKKMHVSIGCDDGSSLEFDFRFLLSSVC